MTWATEDDVPNRYKDKVNQDDLDLAQLILEPFVGITDDPVDRGVIGTRNRRLLRNSVVFQAIWLQAHPDLLTTMQVGSAGSDGLSASFNDIDAQLLAPMAKRCINRLSWKTAPLRIRPARKVDYGYLNGDRDSATLDDERVWSRL